jgi:hypothetical protein
MKWSNGYRMKWMLCGVVTVIMLLVANTRGEYFQDDFDRPDGGVGNGWEIDNRGNLDIKIVDNELLISGQQRGDWNRSGIYRPVEGETRFSFDFKADNLAVHIELDDAETLDTYSTLVEVFASPGGPFYYTAPHEGSIGWSPTEIPGSYMIPGEYNTLVVEQDGTEFTLILNGQVVGAFTNDYFTRVGDVFISADARVGTVGSLHIDNVEIGKPALITAFDFNADGIVDAADVCVMIDHWGEDYSLCDIWPKPSGDGIVDVQDLIVLSEHLFLAAYWKLDESEGNLAQNSMNDNHGILYGEPLWQPDSGQRSGALEFDGVDDCVDIGFVLNPAECAFSAFAWIKGGAPGQVILSQADGPSWTGEIWLGIDPSSGSLMTGIRPPDGRSPRPPMIADAFITDGQWHHVGIVVAEQKVRSLYVDGTRAAFDHHSVELPCSDGGLIIGSCKTLDAGTFFSGLIDEVRIYNKALNAGEIAALAQ